MTTKSGGRSAVRMYGSFFLMVLITVLVLKLVNWLPSTFFKEDIRKFRTLDEVRAELNVARIYTPTYFPEHIQWPPSVIFAQRKPFMLIVMHFPHSDSRMHALSIYQADRHARYEPPLDILQQKDARAVTINNRNGTLILADCRGNERCNSLSWEEGDFRITLVSDDIPDQLMRMAKSMVHE